MRVDWKRRALVVAGLVGCLCLCGIATWTRQAAAKFQRQQKGAALRAACDRAEAIYKVGESVAFQIQSELDGEANYRLSEDGHKTIKTGKITLHKGEKATVNG